MSDEKIINYPLEIPFKDFMPGQVIQSGQFNDDMAEIEEKVNEVVEKHNILTNETDNHVSNKDNPHGVTAHQVGTYSEEEIDAYFEDIRSGGLYDKSIENRVLDDDCIETRNIKNGSITSIKVDSNFGSQLNISKNIDITDRYTKKEVNDLLTQKVGEGTYSKEELDQMFEDVQAGTIVDGTIDVSKLKNNVGKLLDISGNSSITDKYTKEEVNVLIQKHGLPRDWGGLGETDYIPPETFDIGTIPVADYMISDRFTINSTNILDVTVKEVKDARGGTPSLNDRLDVMSGNINNEINDLSTRLTTQISQTNNTIQNLTNELHGKQFVSPEGIGYKELPGGLILQWGYVKFEWDDTRDKIVHYPTSFRQFCFSHVASVRGIDNNWSATVNSHALDNQRFRVVLSNNAQGSFNAVFWFAIGM